MRVTAKKRKIVPIVAEYPINMTEYLLDPQKEGEHSKEELSRILGKKILEFCRVEINHAGRHPNSVTARIMVVDMGKDGVKRKKC